MFQISLVVLMLSTRKSVFWSFLAFECALAAQTPLLAAPGSSLSFDSNFKHDRLCKPVASGELGRWDLDESPAENATGNLVFETVNSLLQHWANTRYRIGRSLKA